MTSSNNQMHNDIMAVGSKERLSMLAPCRYIQWKSHFMRYIDTKPNRELLRKCIYEGPYEMTLVQLEDTPSDDKNPRRPGKEIVKPPSPLSESASEEDSDEEQAQRDKQILKSLAFIEKQFKNIYKPTNNNLITSSNTMNKNMDTSRTGNE
ncbi:hypothetical protein Tco_0453657 [Tanacetum coccineum]